MTAHKNYGHAALYALTGFTGWTLGDTALKLVRAQGVPQGEILLISGLSGMAVILATAILRGKARSLQPRRWRGLFAIGLCQLVAFICWITALPHLPLTNMYAVAFMTPMTVAGMAALLLKEHLGWKRGFAILTGFIGVIVAVDPGNLLQHSGNRLSYLAVLGAMVGTAGQMLFLRVVSQHESSECTAFYPRVVVLTAGTIACALTGFVAMPPWVFLCICLSGAFGGLGWALMSQAYKNASAAAVAPFHYSQMITGAVLGYFIWGDVPGGWLIGGAVIIMASGIYLVRHERRTSRTMVRG